METFACAGICGGLRVHLHSISPLDQANACALLPGAESSVSAAGGCMDALREPSIAVAHGGCVRKGASL